MEEQQEIWKDVIIEKNGVVYDYTGLYQVSNLGRGRNSRTGGILKPSQDNNGYLTVGLSKNGKVKKFYVHRLVATAFIPNPDNLTVVNHRDECKNNNCVENLEWCTQKYNSQYSAKPKSEEAKRKMSEARKGKPVSEETKQKMSEAKSKKVICLETLQIFDTITKAGEWCGITNTPICNHLRGRAKYSGKHPITGEKLHWMYYEDWLKLQENEKIAD